MPTPRIPRANIPVIQQNDGTISRPWQRFLQTAQNPFFPIQPNLTALAGGGQTGATILDFGTNIIVTVANIGDSTQLPPSTGSALVVFVANNTAKAANVFPTLGDQINKLGVNAAISIPAGKCGLFVDVAPLQFDGGTLG